MKYSFYVQKLILPQGPNNNNTNSSNNTANKYGVLSADELILVKTA
jgi:hypothetical protein